MLRDDVKETSFQPMELDEVNRIHLGKAREQSSQHSGPSGLTAGNETSEAWMAKAPSPKRPKNRRGTLARMSIFPAQQDLPQVQQPDVTKDGSPSLAVQSSPDSFATDVPDYGVGESNTPLVQPPEKNSENTAGDLAMLSALPDQEPLEMVHEVLLKVLYNPKYALTHFTKSTLSRIRAGVRSS